MDRILLNIRKPVWPRAHVTWTVEQLHAWLHEVEPVADSRGKFDWLEIPPIASSSAIQEAYHQVARSRHPDLFRGRVDNRTMDRLVRMYARVTAAYADLKEPEKLGAYLRDLRGPRIPTNPPPDMSPSIPRTTTPPPMAKPPTEPPQSRIAVPPSSSTPKPTTPPPVAIPEASASRQSQPIPKQPPSGVIDPAHSMNARALSFYRRAEGILKTGDRAAALLQLKMAIAADPKSTFLRAALAELTRS